jgi:hypothetical protein
MLAIGNRFYKTIKAAPAIVGAALLFLNGYAHLHYPSIVIISDRTYNQLWLYLYHG